MSCCADKCNCGSNCSCSSCGCSSCGKMYPDMEMASTVTIIGGGSLPPTRSSIESAENSFGNEGGHGCKCGSNCKCDPCTC